MTVGINFVRKGEKLHAAGFKVIVKVEEDKAKEKHPGASSIEIPEWITEKETVGSERGVIVEIGPLAGRTPGETPEDWGLKVGNIVYFNRYQAEYYKRADGEAYLVVGDRFINAYIDPEETEDARA